MRSLHAVVNASVSLEIRCQFERSQMKPLIFFAIAAALAAQQSSTQPARPAGHAIPESAGDDVRGYNDTPQLPGQNGSAPSDAIVLFDGKDLSHWMQMGRDVKLEEPKWKVENGSLEIVPRTGKLVTK